MNKNKLEKSINDEMWMYNQNVIYSRRNILECDVLCSEYHIERMFDYMDAVNNRYKKQNEHMNKLFNKLKVDCSDKNISVKEIENMKWTIDREIHDYTANVCDLMDDILRDKKLDEKIRKFVLIFMEFINDRFHKQRKIIHNLLWLLNNDWKHINHAYKCTLCSNTSKQFTEMFYKVKEQIYCEICIIYVALHDLPSYGKKGNECEFCHRKTFTLFTLKNKKYCYQCSIYKKGYIVYE